MFASSSSLASAPVASDRPCCSLSFSHRASNLHRAPNASRQKPGAGQPSTENDNGRQREITRATMAKHGMNAERASNTPTPTKPSNERAPHRLLEALSIRCSRYDSRSSIRHVLVCTAIRREGNKQTRSQPPNEGLSVSERRKVMCHASLRHSLTQCGSELSLL